MDREESFGRREGEGMAPGEPFASLEVELAAFFLAFGRLEGRGMRLEEEEMRLEEWGTRCQEVFE
ncbi:MAG: hypothetical protein ACJ76Y_01460 [Thermoanaerobaculia bacterium]